MSEPIIRVNHLTKQYRIGTAQTQYPTLRESISRAARNILSHGGDKKNSTQTILALDDVSFEIQKGEAVGIIGRNGAGKSTLLKILSRITRPTKGRIELGGRVGSLLEVGTGFHPELTGRENIFMNGAILGMQRREIENKFDEIVAFSEVEKFLDTPVKRYSSGMYMRLAFAVAAHLDPEILVVDEVLAVGDAQFQKKCLGKMGDAAQQGRTVLFVSHNMGAISRLCSRTLLLTAGKMSIFDETGKVVGEYLKRSSPTGSGFREKDKNVPAYIEKVDIKNPQGRISEEFDTQESIQVMIDFVVKQDVRGTAIACGVFDFEGKMIIDTHDTDLSPDLRNGRIPGKYRTTLEIPGKLLNPGRYELAVFAGNPNLYQTYDTVRDIYFTVDDFSGASVVGYGPRRSAVLGLEIEWETNRRNED